MLRSGHVVQAFFLEKSILSRVLLLLTGFGAGVGMSKDIGVYQNFFHLKPVLAQELGLIHHLSQYVRLGWLPLSISG